MIRAATHYATLTPFLASMPHTPPIFSLTPLLCRHMIFHDAMLLIASAFHCRLAASYALPPDVADAITAYAADAAAAAAQRVSRYATVLLMPTLAADAACHYGYADAPCYAFHACYKHDAC